VSVTTTIMADTIAASEKVDPKMLAGIKYVGGYVSGTPDILWTPEEWASLSASQIKVRIWQGYGNGVALHDFDEIDVESGAVTPSEAAHVIEQRVAAGITWTQVYGTRASLAATAAAVKALGEAVWIGHVTCRLADWNLSREEANGLVGTFVEGMTCTGVQWASPESNPNTIMPGPSGKTLRQANCDLSVVDANWVPSLVVKPPVTPPVGGKTLKEIIAKWSDGSTSSLLTL